MTTTDNRLTACPGWCAEEEREHHGELHESRVWGFLLPDRGPTAPLSLHVALSKTATGWDPAEVTVHDGDALLTSISPSSARSLAALLLHAADVAEGLR